MDPFKLEKQTVNLEHSHYKQLFFKFFYLIFCLQCVGSSLPKDRTNDPCTGITESLTLDHQRSPSTNFLK